MTVDGKSANDPVQLDETDPALEAAGTDPDPADVATGRDPVEVADRDPDPRHRIPLRYSIYRRN